MFLKLDHQKFDVYEVVRSLARKCFLKCRDLPYQERTVLSHQIRKAALSVHLNLSEGFSRKSPVERKRFFEIARGSVVEVDAAFDLAIFLKYIKAEDLATLEQLIIRSFQLLTGIIKMM